MKKTISINIGGIIFHIEEDGYEKLKSYLASINKYFSSFEDSSEIINDIENRISEIFLSRLDEGKQVITAEDVNDLIATMGTTKDFDASIETEEPKVDQQPEEKPHTEDHDAPPREPVKRLYRDTKRKVIGGVAAGIANYLGIDPIWIRLLMLALLFNIFFWGLSGFIFLAYIVLWIAVPANDKLEDDKAVKKLFRSPDDRVLGGVAGGIASYFGTDPVAIRVLFVISIFLGGAGILLYIILWIITPEARSITEKMQMQGEPVTLSNIEENVKKSLNVKEGEESVFIKILLFPFRLIAMIFKTLSQVLGPLLKVGIEVLRIALGVLLVIIGFSLMLGLTISIIALAGTGYHMESSWMQFHDFPVRQLFDSMSVLAIISAYLTTAIPALALLLLGLVIILKRKVTNAFVAWSLLGLWFLGMIGLAISIPAIVGNYRSEATYKEERTFPLNAGITELRLNETEWDAFYGVNLKLRGQEDTSSYLMIMEFESRGSSREDAREHAKAVDYHVIQSNDTFYFDSGLSFEEAPFRFQEVSVTFYIPYGKKFIMSDDLREILRNTLWIHGYDAGDLGENQWVFDSTGLKCLTCEQPSSKSYQRYGSDSQEYQFRDFDEVSFVSLFDFEIERGDEYLVRIEGDDDDLDDVYLSQDGDELEIRYSRGERWWRNTRRRDRIKVFVQMPELEYVRASGSCNGDVRDFTSDELYFEIDGASKIWAEVDVRYMDVDLSGASELTLVGSGEELSAELSGASSLDAFSFIVKDAEVDASGASKARVHVTDELVADASGASRIRYRGAARLSTNSNGLSSIRKE